MSTRPWLLALTLLVAFVFATCEPTKEDESSQEKEEKDDNKKSEQGTQQGTGDQGTQGDQQGTGDQGTQGDQQGTGDQGTQGDQTQPVNVTPATYTKNEDGFVVEREPNNHYGNADIMALPFKGMGSLDPDDIDWWEFELPTEAQISIKYIKPKGENPDIKLYLHDAKVGGKEMHFSDHHISKLLKPGKYYLRIIGYYDQFYDKPGQYSFELTAGDIEQQPPKQLRKKIAEPCPKRAELWGLPYPDGYSSWCAELTRGQRHGPYWEWYENGNYSFIGEYTFGRRTGIHTWWNEDGEKKEICDFGADSKKMECHKCKTKETPREKPCD